MISTKIMSRWRRRHWVDEMHKLASDTLKLDLYLLSS